MPPSLVMSHQSGKLLQDYFDIDGGENTVDTADGSWVVLVLTVLDQRGEIIADAGDGSWLS